MNFSSYSGYGEMLEVAHTNPWPVVGVVMTSVIVYFGMKVLWKWKGWEW